MVTGGVTNSVVERIAANTIIEWQTITIDDIKVFLRFGYGLDQPVHIHYLRWMGLMKQEDGLYHGVLEGDLGHSVWE